MSYIAHVTEGTGEFHSNSGVTCDTATCSGVTCDGSHVTSAVRSQAQNNYRIAGNFCGVQISFFLFSVYQNENLSFVLSILHRKTQHAHRNVHFELAGDSTERNLDPTLYGSVYGQLCMCVFHFELAVAFEKMVAVEQLLYFEPYTLFQCEVLIVQSLPKYGVLLYFSPQRLLLVVLTRGKAW